MYVISNVPRVYIAVIFFLCLASFSTATLGADGYWSTNERRFVPQSEVNRNVQRILDSSVRKPTGSTLGASPTSPTVTKNPAGGLSSTTQNTIKTMGHPSTFNSTLNNSVSSARTALKSCVRSPACAGRALGGGAIIYEGIKAWKDVYEIVYDDTDNSFNQLDPKPYQYSPEQLPSGSITTTDCRDVGVGSCVLVFKARQFGNDPTRDIGCNTSRPDATFLGSVWSNSPCVYYPHSLGGDVPYPPENIKPISLSDLDNMIDDGYEPAVSDAPIVLLSDNPESISLSTPPPVDLPSTTTTSTNSSGQTTTSVTNNTINYNVTNNNTSSPSINSSTSSTTITYDNNSNVVDTSTSTTTENGVQPDVSPSAPPIEFELPSFCSWASIVCDWIGWTKEGVEGEEPDLINLISEFEPDEGEYISSIGAGSCPAPMSIYLSLIKQTVEVSYQPFCDFLEMIRPLVIAGAWLLSAFMYVGVLRRG
ncbi:MAG: 50-kDa virion protein [Inoviridae sp.]|nr:MAG: 50-kDa virion protein [Inoviridae sp.]